MTEELPEDSFKWYAVQTASNQELKVKRHLDRFIESDSYGNYIRSVLVPTKTVVEVKNGKKTKKMRKFYPGYVFLQMQLYAETGEMLQPVVSCIKGIQGVLNFMGGDVPVALKKKEVDGIIGQLEATKGKALMKVTYTLGETVKITDGPFLNVTGKISEIDPERGKLKVSVSIFGRFTPVELEYWQVQKEE
jgi:transcriptional antiterminator NusG